MPRPAAFVGRGALGVMRGEPDHGQHESDREFIAWVRKAISEDLRAKWYALYDIGWLPDLWKTLAIERELARRGEPPP